MLWSSIIKVKAEKGPKMRKVVRLHLFLWWRRVKTKNQYPRYMAPLDDDNITNQCNSKQFLCASRFAISLGHNSFPPPPLPFQFLFIVVKHDCSFATSFRLELTLCVHLRSWIKPVSLLPKTNWTTLGPFGCKFLHV